MAHWLKIAALNYVNGKGGRQALSLYDISVSMGVSLEWITHSGGGTPVTNQKVYTQHKADNIPTDATSSRKIFQAWTLTDIQTLCLAEVAFPGHVL